MGRLAAAAAAASCFLAALLAFLFDLERKCSWLEGIALGLLDNKRERKREKHNHAYEYGIRRNGIKALTPMDDATRVVCGVVDPHFNKLFPETLLGKR